MKTLLAIILLVSLSAQAQFESPAMVGAMTAPVVSGGGGGQTKLQDVVDYAKTIPGVYAIYAASNGWFSSSSGNGTWSNLSSTAGIDLTNLASGTSTQPVLANSSFNGHAALNFDGSGMYLNSANFSLAQPNEYWLVLIITNKYSGAVPYAYSSVSTPRQFMSVNPSVARMQMYAGTSINAANGTWRTNLLYVVSHAYNGASSKIYTNNIAPSMFATDPGTNGQNGLTIGAYAIGNSYMSMSLAMLICFSTNLDHTSTGVSSNLFNLVTNCYGITF